MAALQQVPEQFVDSADGVRIAVYEEGNREGPTVVLVHGFPDSHVLWDGVVPLLAERFRVIRYDNRGVGLASAPTPVSCRLPDRVPPTAARTGQRAKRQDHEGRPSVAACAFSGRTVFSAVGCWCVTHSITFMNRLPCPVESNRSARLP